MLTARDAKATIELDPETLNPHFSYLEDGNTHRVWFLDAVTAYNHLRAADKYRPAGYALGGLAPKTPRFGKSCLETTARPPPASLETITRPLT